MWYQRCGNKTKGRGGTGTEGHSRKAVGPWRCGYRDTMGVTSVSPGRITGAAPRGGAGTAGTPGRREEHSGGPRVPPAPAHGRAPAAGWPPPPRLPALLPVPPGEQPHVPMAPGCPRGSPCVLAYQQPFSLSHQISGSPAITTHPDVSAISPLCPLQCPGQAPNHPCVPNHPTMSPDVPDTSPAIPTASTATCPCPQLSPPLQVAVVPQEPLLFARSLHANISYGLGGCSRAQVTAAARRVGAHDFITRLPQGYDTGKLSPLCSGSPPWSPSSLTLLSPQRWASWEDSSPGGSGRQWPLPVRCCGTPASSYSTSTPAPWTLRASSRWDVPHVPVSPHPPEPCVPSVCTPRSPWSPVLVSPYLHSWCPSVPGSG